MKPKTPRPKFKALFRWVAINKRGDVCVLPRVRKSKAVANPGPDRGLWRTIRLARKGRK